MKYLWVYLFFIGACTTAIFASQAYVNMSRAAHPGHFSGAELEFSNPQLTVFADVDSLLADYDHVLGHVTPDDAGYENEPPPFYYVPLISMDNPLYFTLKTAAAQFGSFEAIPVTARPKFEHIVLLLRDYTYDVKAPKQGLIPINLSGVRLYAPPQNLPVPDRIAINESFDWPDLDRLIILELQPHHDFRTALIVHATATLLFLVLSLRAYRRAARTSRRPIAVDMPPVRQNGIANPYKP